MKLYLYLHSLSPFLLPLPQDYFPTLLTSAPPLSFARTFPYNASISFVILSLCFTPLKSQIYLSFFIMLLSLTLRSYIFTTQVLDKVV